MKQSNELASREAIGNIWRTPCGIVSVNIRGVSVRFTDDSFMWFASMVAKANSVLIDNSLREIIGE